MFFFFQAEDGIRDLVRSRGLEMCIRDRPPGAEARRGQDLKTRIRKALAAGSTPDESDGNGPVSYTHLTLPTSDLV